MNKKLKITLIGLGVLVLVTILLTSVIPNIFEDDLQEILSQEFYRNTEHRYILDSKELDISLWKHSISIDSITITAASDASRLKNARLKLLSIDGITWLSLLHSKIPEFGSITIDSPNITLSDWPRSKPEEIAPKFGSIDSSGSDIKPFDIHIKGASASVLDSFGIPKISLSDFNFEIEDFRVNAFINKTDTALYSKASFTGKHFKYRLDKMLYEITASDFGYNSAEKRAYLTQFCYTPLAPKYKFAEYRGKRVDRYDLKIDKINVDEVRVNPLLSPVIDIGTITVQNAWLEIFHDLHMPHGAGMSYKPLLNTLAHKIDFPIAINRADINNTTIIYGEHSSHSDDPGYISFNNLNATVSWFRSASHPKFRDDTLTLKATAMFMNLAPLEVDISYPVFNENDMHHIKARLGEIDGKDMNSVLTNLAFMQIKSGHVNNLSFEMNLDNKQATGEMILVYSDLNIEMLDKNDSDNTNFKTHLSTFLANNFVLNENNGPENPRVGIISLERPKDKSIFGYWWKSILSGLQSSIK